MVFLHTKSTSLVAIFLCLLSCLSQPKNSLFAEAFASPSRTTANTMIDPSEAAAMEDVVRRYFDGVNRKDPVQIKSCFGEQATIRDVCGINDSKRNVVAQDLADRCMEFLTAHPDTKVDFHYGPECGRNSRWVVAHWYETGTWSGESCGVLPTNEPMEVEGQTRFHVSSELKIVDMVVTRTFTEWEQAMLEKRQQEQEQAK